MEERVGKVGGDGNHLFLVLMERERERERLLPPSFFLSTFLVYYNSSWWII